ncbi:MAG: hypothetical protein IJD79_05860 [Clostridia bacterium]|nr:hypothetical protein [Clostridia bacterium]
MQMYKISTLGKSFVIANKGFLREGTNFSDEKVLQEREDGIRVEISQNLEWDYIIDIPSPVNVYYPDLYRALLVFLYLLKGYPYSEYDLFSVMDNKRIILPDCCGKYGGNVGKCKLLCSKSLKCAEKGDVDINFVQTPIGCYAVVLCDNPSSVDLARIISMSITEMSVGISLSAAMAISFSAGIADISVRYIDASSLPHTTAYAAAYYLLGILQNEKVNMIRSGNIFAECEFSSHGVSVYDPDPKVYKIV